MRKGIVLAGGSGSRLYPSTRGVSKQLLPVYDKPTLYYPISTLMLSGIRQFLIISTPRDLPLIQQLLGDGRELGVTFEYALQAKPEGIAQAFLIGESFIGNDNVSLILGDNLFYGQDLSKMLQTFANHDAGATLFAYHVVDPGRFGVVEMDRQGRAIDIVEKPAHPKSNWAVTGLYCYDATVVARAKSLKPSPRGELEITDLNKDYLRDGQAQVVKLGRGTAWLDTGTHDSLMESSMFIYSLEKRQGLKVGCLEEVAFRMGFITFDQFHELAHRYPPSSYGEYLRKLCTYFVEEST